MELVAASPGYAQIAGTVTREGTSHARAIAPVATGNFRDHIGETRVWTTRNRVRVPVYRILAAGTEENHAWYVEFGSRRGGRARRSGARHTFRKTLKHMKGNG